ncbi:MAG: ParA family protein [Chloroflexota bacterium]
MESQSGEKQHGYNPPGGNPQIIAIANQKGGVAKTTSVASLGGALASRGIETLLIDLDAQANLTLALGFEPARLRGAVSQFFFNSASLWGLSRPTATPFLDLVPSNTDMEMAEHFLPLRKNYETMLRRALGRQPDAKDDVRHNSASACPYDFIILDCPPVLGAVTTNALIAADLLIIPTQPEYFSAHALRTMLGYVRQVRSQFNPQLSYRILITMHDQRNRIHRQISQQIRQAFGAGVFETTIGIDTRLRESALQGVPITADQVSAQQRNSRSAQQYRALANELVASSDPNESLSDPIRERERSPMGVRQNVKS